MANAQERQALCAWHSAQLDRHGALPDRSREAWLRDWPGWQARQFRGLRDLARSGDGLLLAAEGSARSTPRSGARSGQDRGARHPIAASSRSRIARSLASNGKRLQKTVGLDLPRLVDTAKTRASERTAADAKGPRLAERGLALLKDFAARIKGKEHDPLVSEHVLKRGPQEIAASQAVASAVRHLGRSARQALHWRTCTRQR